MCVRPSVCITYRSAFRKGVCRLDHSAFHSYSKMVKQGMLHCKAYFFLKKKKKPGDVKSRDLDSNGLVGGSPQVAESVM